MFYVNKFLFFSIIYIWKSIKSWYFIIHAFKIAQNVQNFILWETSNKIIENRILIKKEKQSQASKFFNAMNRSFLQTCNRYNIEFECYFNCKYQHACLICEIESHFALQYSIKREQSLSREKSWNQEKSSKRDKNANMISRERSWLAIFNSLRWIFEFFFTY
jgi:hypothetical protein